LDNGVTAGELAMELGLSRANVSSDLNRLCEERYAEKYGTKPVYYRVFSQSEEQNTGSLLDMFAHSNKSLFHCVEQVKAAVLYPPHGMHMMLFGETGVGKSMFAELIHRYAIEKSRISDKAPFIVFNCADYTNNPQLLVSQLMGTKKGAYTGADSDKPGLLEKADGGILFLDEVHRLPPQGQEMLFTFIDRGVYRRLGETDLERRSVVLLICATTEDQDSVLLKTFLRRIPMIIKIPSLKERSMDERLNLISSFFQSESVRLGKPISVSVNSMRSLLSYSCPNNIGQLKNDIRILCAKAYSDFISGKRKDLNIVSFDLPSYIKEGLYLETTHRQIWNRFVGINKRYCVFDSNSKDLLLHHSEDSESIYDIIDTIVEELKADGASDNEINHEIDEEIRRYFEKYLKVEDDPQDHPAIQSLAGNEVMEVVDTILAYAGEKLDRSFGNSIRYGMSVHIHNSIDRIKRNRRIINPQLNNIRKEYGPEFSVALECLKIINQEFDMLMPIDEAGFLAVFLGLDSTSSAIQDKKTQVIVIAHGAATASSMAGAANRLLGTDYAVGIDASLDENPQKVYNRLKDYLSNPHRKNDLLLLVDMGALTSFSSNLEKELGIRVKTVPLVSTLHVVEATRKAALGYPLDYVYQEVLRVNELMNEPSVSFSAKSSTTKLFVVTICTTGEGSALLLKNLLDSRLDYHNALCETVTISLIDNNSIYERLNIIGHLGKILCIVGTFKVDIDIPHFGLTDVIEGQAIKKIQELIDIEVTFDRINHTLANMLKNINSSTIFLDIRRMIERIEVRIGNKLLPDVLIGVSCHVGCMLDRIKEDSSSVIEFPGKESFKLNNPGLVQIVETSCKRLEEEFDVRISDDEYYYIASFFVPDNFVAKS